MKKDFRLGLEKLDNRALLSSNPWYIESIRANEVWSSVPTLTSKPVVAIIDSGIDLNHTDLKNNIWTNPSEIAGNNKDDDGNGYVDDIRGWDFVDMDNSPNDVFYHGTHVAGIIDAVGNNNISLLPLKFIGSSGSGYVGSAVAAINYAISLKLKGVNITAINCSFGGTDTISSSLSNAIKNASDNGIIVVLAAGNNGVNMDVSPKYPGSLSYANTITVGAINPDSSLAAYSNYGKKSVHVVAPGTSIYSTLPGNSYGTVSGTSMSTAVVSGSVGLLKTLGNYNSNQIKNAIVQGCGVLSGLLDKVQYGLINVLKSWNLLKAMKIETPVVAAPVTVVSKITYGITNVSRTVIIGWVAISNSNAKPIVEIYINNVLRYSLVAKTYRTATKTADGFSVYINQKFLNSSKQNLIEVRIKDPNNKATSVIYKKYV